MNPLKRLRSFISDYSHFADSAIIVPLSLWIAGTYIYEAFDSFPYLVITARVKRAGKTRLSELIGFTCQMPFRVAGASAASMFRKIQDDKPTIIWDEAEMLSSESSSLVRAFLNVGYRKGQTIPRASGDGVIEWPTYCPKTFVLIGDVYDTLQDRSIVVTMQRGEPKKRFMYETAKMEGFDIAEEIKLLVADNLCEISAAYESLDISFLTDRDEEIWRPLFAIAKVIDPEYYQALKRVAVDLATEKTNPVKYVPNEESERKSEQEEYGLRLLADLLTITKGRKAIASAEAIDKLRAIDIAPWRKYGGTGLTRNNSTEPYSMQSLLLPFGVTVKPIREGSKVFKGYSRKDLEIAAKKAGLK